MQLSNLTDNLARVQIPKPKSFYATNNPHPRYWRGKTRRGLLKILGCTIVWSVRNSVQNIEGILGSLSGGELKWVRRNKGSLSRTTSITYQQPCWNYIVVTTYQWSPEDGVFIKRDLRFPVLYREAAFGQQWSYQLTVYTKYKSAENRGLSMDQKNQLNYYLVYQMTWAALRPHQRKQLCGVV